MRNSNGIRTSGYRSGNVYLLNVISYIITCNGRGGRVIRIEHPGIIGFGTVADPYIQIVDQFGRTIVDHTSCCCISRGIGPGYGSNERSVARGNYLKCLDLPLCKCFFADQTFGTVIGNGLRSIFGIEHTPAINIIRARIAGIKSRGTGQSFERCSTHKITRVFFGIILLQQVKRTGNIGCRHRCT